MPEVVVFAREGCHLCEEAFDALISLGRGEYGFTLREVDIESDDELHRALLERIPVVQIDGVVVSELRLDESAVRARLDTLKA